MMGLFSSSKNKLSTEQLQEIEKKSLENIDKELNNYYIPSKDYKDDNRTAKAVIPEQFKKEYPEERNVFESDDIRYYRDLVAECVKEEIVTHTKAIKGKELGSNMIKKYAHDIIDDIIDEESENRLVLFKQMLILL